MISDKLWVDIEAESRDCPYLAAAVAAVGQGAPREDVVIAVALTLSRRVREQHERIVDLVSRQERVIILGVGEGRLTRS